MARGGKREGAGRPFLDDPRDKKVQVSVTIQPNTKIKINALKEHGIKIGKIVDEAVNDAEGSGMVFDDLSSAQDYLIETFGVKRTEIRSKKGVIEFGNSHGVNIIISD